jgi:hypothetical protein
MHLYCKPDPVFHVAEGRLWKVLSHGEILIALCDSQLNALPTS